MAGAYITSSPDSDLEAFSHNPAHGSFAPLTFHQGHDQLTESTVPLVLGKYPEGTAPSPSPGQHAATRSHRGRNSRSPPTAVGSGLGPHAQSLKLIIFSKYGSILITSLAYIVPLTRGYSPWRPDAVMSTIGHGWHSVLWIFKGQREHTGHHAMCGALPAVGPYLWLSHF
ncbi:hypothetical protein RND71_012986 [Anisodus tanguticus]|uniref:Uncharacterized protein n=1 Tax=Anisodus tanguticus TaxID=243964 RepID=A0AAE1SED1_9SOLA|nr:hypothetical protein RND71_012986 [Anisodus tanguticus]